MKLYVVARADWDYTPDAFFEEGVGEVGKETMGLDCLFAYRFLPEAVKRAHALSSNPRSMYGGDVIRLFEIDTESVSSAGSLRINELDIDKVYKEKFGDE